MQPLSRIHAAPGIIRGPMSAIVGPRVRPRLLHYLHGASRALDNRRLLSVLPSNFPHQTIPLLMLNSKGAEALPTGCLPPRAQLVHLSSNVQGFPFKLLLLYLSGRSHLLVRYAQLLRSPLPFSMDTLSTNVLVPRT